VAMAFDAAMTSGAVLIDGADQFSARAAAVAQELGPSAMWPTTTDDVATVLAFDIAKLIAKTRARSDRVGFRLV
jgi:hypothetical protein